MDDSTKGMIYLLFIDLLKLANVITKLAPDRHQFYNDTIVDAGTMSDHRKGPFDPVSDVNSAILSPELAPELAPEGDRDPVFVQTLKSADRVEKAFLANWQDEPLRQGMPCLADALDALAGQCLHETPPGVHGTNQGRRYILAGEIRTIANELRQ